MISWEFLWALTRNIRKLYKIMCVYIYIYNEFMNLNQFESKDQDS